MNKEILEHLIEYLQQKIDSGEHKIFYNDLMYDEKTIDCINAINNTFNEIERLKNMIKAEEKISNLLPDETDFIIVRREDYNRLFGSESNE